LESVSSVPPLADVASVSDGQRNRISEFAWQPQRKFQDRVWRHALLLALTLGTTTLAGLEHYASFVTDFGVRRLDLSTFELATGGLWYSLTILAILGCHELGHYFACRYYDVDASMPYFLPFPLAFSGTLGAFIRIREPIPSKRMLFDIGIAGPIAGFLIAVPALFFGLALSRPAVFPSDAGGYELGEPLLFQAAAWLMWGDVPSGYTLNMHPMAFAAWFGLLATALNLFPIGQLDGGHISYAVLGRRSSHVTLAMIPIGLVLMVFSLSWTVWLIVTLAMLLAFGRHHPRTFDEGVPLDPARKWLALFAIVMLALCFTPAPIRPLDLLR
jgi:membrane-associated protease RseP (regulator of RpoE activity)